MSDIEIKDKTIEAFLDELASKSATPGGGSVAALMGAQAAALVSMVCNLTIGKPKYAEVEADMHALLEKSEALRETLTDMIRADVEVFNRLMTAYRLPKETDADKAQRSTVIQGVLKDAIVIPLECAEACLHALTLSRIAAEKGSIAVISDAGVAATAAYAGVKSAALNVYINAGSLKDNDFAEEKLAELAIILNGLDEKLRDTYLLVQNKL
jgi:methenyltetrahydrofolate cyclohydrolase